MSKVKDLAERVVACFSEHCHENFPEQLVDALIKAVRDEEYLKAHAAKMRTLGMCHNNGGCLTCPAKGTRYCLDENL